MEFFDWMTLPGYVFDYLQIDGDLTEQIAYLLNLYGIFLWISAGLYLVIHLLGGIGLYTMAKRAGIKGGWMGFVPFLNTYLSGKLAGEFTVFGSKMKRAGLYTMLIEILYVAISIFTLVITLQCYNPAYYDEIIQNGVSVGWEFNLDNVPLAARDLVRASDILGYVNYAVSLILYFFMCILYNAFFRKYYARSPFLMAFLCAFLPLRGIVLFCVRNNTPIDYNAYMRQRMQQYQQRQQQYGPHYGQTPYNPPPPKGEEPFSDMGGSGGGNPPDDDAPFSDL